MKVKNTLASLFVFLVLFVIGWGVWFSMHEWVPAGNVGVLYHANGGLENKVYSPRWMFVPPMTQLYTYPVKEQAAIYCNDTQEGEDRAADAVRVTSNDASNTDFDIVVYYHIEPNDVLKIFNNNRGQPIKTIQSTVIRASVRQQASIVGKDYDAFALMGKSREEASEKLTNLLKKELIVNGITVDNAYFATSYPNEQIQQRIVNQVNAETDLNIAKIDKDKASVNKDIAIIRAQASAEASRLKSAQTQTKSLELMELETKIAAMRKWNGHLPPVKVQQGQTVIITSETLNALQGGRR